MMDQKSISINQVKELATDLVVNQSKYLKAPESGDQFIVVTKEETDKVEFFKQHEQYGLLLNYHSDYNQLIIGLRPDLNNVDTTVGFNLPVNEEMIEELKKISTTAKNIELYIVGTDLETISARPIFNSDGSKDMLAQKIKQVKG